MKHLVEYSLEDGSSIVVEIDEPETGGTTRASREDGIEKAKETFEEALDKVLPATKNIIAKLRSMESKPENKPDEIEVTFGISMSTVASAIIASASIGGNFGITLHWTEKANDETH